jgi:hypothetical protein
MGPAIKRVSSCIWAGLICFFNLSAAEKESISKKQSSVLDPDFKRFVGEKRELVRRLGEKHGDAVPQMVWDFFDYAQQGDWPTTTNLLNRIDAGSARKSRNPRLPMSLWAPILEVYGAYDQFRTWNGGLLHRFGNGVITKIPAGSIYFGGTDAGRFIISSLSTSQTEGRPFFTVTQNALADGSYIDYLRDIYGTKIHVPTAEELQKAFQEYLDDAAERLKKNQIMEGESVEVVNDRVQVSGVTAVMVINEKLANVIIEKNPTFEIYLEESYPLESL